jgi:hypothetical protein
MKLALLAIVCLLFLSDPFEEYSVYRQQVGWIELNRVLDENTQQVRLEQLIFWDVHPVWGCKECRGWIPARKAILVGNRVLLPTSERIYSIEGAFVIQTETLIDPELENRLIIPLDQRRHLLGLNR